MVGNVLFRVRYFNGTVFVRQTLQFNLVGSYFLREQMDGDIYLARTNSNSVTISNCGSVSIISVHSVGKRTIHGLYYRYNINR